MRVTGREAKIQQLACDSQGKVTDPGDMYVESREVTEPPGYPWAELQARGRCSKGAKALDV